MAHPTHQAEPALHNKMSMIAGFCVVYTSGGASQVTSLTSPISEVTAIESCVQLHAGIEIIVCAIVTTASRDCTLRA